MIDVRVETGWNDVAKGKIMVKSLTENVAFHLDKTICEMSTQDSSMQSLDPTDLKQREN